MSVFSLQEAGLKTDRAWAEPAILDVQRTACTLLKQTYNNLPFLNVQHRASLTKNFGWAMNFKVKSEKYHCS